MPSALAAAGERSTRDLDETTIRSLWALRLRNTSLRPELDLEVAYQRWRAYFDRDASAVIVRDARGEPCGFFVYQRRLNAVGGTTRMVVEVQCGYVDRAHRGSLAVRLAQARSLGVVAARYPLLEKVSVYLAFPPSVAAVWPYARRISAPGDPDVSGWRRDAFDTFLRESLGADDDADYDPETGVARVETLPTVRIHAPRSEQSRQSLAWYEERNPRWREGYALPILVETDSLVLARGCLRALGLVDRGAQSAR